MKRLLLSAAALSVFLGAHQAWAADGTFQRALSTGSSPSVSVYTGSGTVRIHPGAGNQVQVTAHLHGNNGWSGGKDVESRIQQIVANPPVHQDGNHVVVGDPHPSDLYRNITIDYDLTVPHDSSIEADTGSGDIETTDVGVSIHAQSGSGSVRAHGVHGPANLGTGSGDIELTDAAPGDVRADTGSGSIRLQGVSGGLRARSGSGDIEVAGALTSDWMLQTGSGSIRLNLGPNTRFKLDADTGSGTVHVAQAISMSGDLNRHHVTGSVNGGGPTLHIQTGSGDVEIR